MNKQQTAKAHAALAKAKEAAGGSGGALARAMSKAGKSISPTAVNNWDVVPIARVLIVEKVTGVPRSDLRPDFYPA